MPAPPLRLGVNVDHVATVRNARGGRHPDPVRAALLAIEAGADGITAHLREDRRHIRDEDMARLKAEISKPLNFEMAATDDMMRISLATKPHAVCLVPERRQEVTTEGGLDVRRPAQCAGALYRAAERCRHPRLAVHRRRPAPDRDGGAAARARDRDPYRRLVRRRGRRPRRQGRGRMAAHRGGREAGAKRAGSRSMPATGSTMRRRRRSPRCRRSWSSISATT